MLSIVDRRQPILGQVERVQRHILPEILDLLDAVLGQIELGQIDEQLQIFDLDDAVALQRQTLEVDELAEVLDALDLVLTQIEVGEVGQLVQSFNGLCEERKQAELVADKEECLNIYPNPVVAQFEHCQTLQTREIGQLCDAIGAQKQFAQFDKCIKVFDLGQTIEADIQNSSNQKLKHYIHRKHNIYLNLTPN